MPSAPFDIAGCDNLDEHGQENLALHDEIVVEFLEKEVHDAHEAKRRAECGLLGEGADEQGREEGAQQMKQLGMP